MVFSGRYIIMIKKKERNPRKSFQSCQTRRRNRRPRRENEDFSGGEIHCHFIEIHPFMLFFYLSFFKINVSSTLVVPLFQLLFSITCCYLLLPMLSRLCSSQSSIAYLHCYCTKLLLAWIIGPHLFMDLHLG